MDSVVCYGTMDGAPRWYRRWWGQCAIAYLVITGGMGVWYLVVNRNARSDTARSDVRAGGLTEAPGAATAMPRSIDPALLIADDDPALGPADAALTIVEFSDFECPYSREFFPTLREAAERYGDRVRFVFRDYPIAEVHPTAHRVAEAAQCAHEQGKFWAYHDRLFQNSDALDEPSLRGHARAVGLDVAAFDACMQSDRSAARVDADLAAGDALGVRGTPTFFFVPRAAPERARKVEGVIPRDQFAVALDRVLAGIAAQRP